MNRMQNNTSSPQKCCELYEAVDLTTDLADSSHAVNRISTTFVSLYPPGIPVLIPGERITEDLIETILHAQISGIEVTGLIDGKFPVVNDLT